VLDVVSSTGHKLRLHLLAFRDTTTSVDIQVQTRDGVEEHDWTFPVPRSAISVSASGKARIRLTSSRSAGRATVSLRTSPHGAATRTTCQGKTATKTRHVTLSGTVLLKTRSSGKHAWGNVGSAHRVLRFTTRSKVTWTRAEASSCPTPEFPCHNTALWQANGGPVGAAHFWISENKGAHAEIEGFRFVTLDQPSGATRADGVTLTQPSPNQLVVNGDGTATMQATFRGGTVTMTADQPGTTVHHAPCGHGHQKITLESWQSVLTNGASPIVLPAQVFGDFSTADLTSAAFGTIKVEH
jgi:hypothetical protein